MKTSGNSSKLLRTATLPRPWPRSRRAPTFDIADCPKLCPLAGEPPFVPTFNRPTLRDAHALPSPRVLSPIGIPI